MDALRRIGLCAGALATAAASGADITYVLQERSITAATTADGNEQTVVSPGFGPFVENLNLGTTFTTPTGGTAPNDARAGIDCQLDPNAIRIGGSLGGAGGLSVVGGTSVLQMGEAAARVNTEFVLTGATAYRMTASPRVSAREGDRFKIKLKNEDTHEVLFFLDETMPAQSVDLTGRLAQGAYEIEYQVEMTVDGPEVLRDFHFGFVLGTCYANCDLSAGSPALNVGDFVCFLNRFAAGDSYANCDGSTIAPALNVQDFGCFLQAFAVGCS